LWLQKAVGFISGGVWPGFVDGRRGWGRSPQPPDAGSLVAKLAQPPEARGSGAGTLSDWRFLNFSIKITHFYAYFA